MKTLLRNSAAQFVVCAAAFSVAIPIGLGLWSRPKPVATDPPPPAKINYHSWPSPRCGKGCEWRDTIGDNIWTLVIPDPDHPDHPERKKVIARVFPVLSYPGYWYVQPNSSTRVMESEWGSMDGAKAHAEDLAAKK